MTEENVIKFYRAVGNWKCYSNLFRCKVEIDGLVFESSEHAYQWAKTDIPHVKEYIRNAPTASLACIVGHGLFPYMVVKDWNKLKVERMRAVLYAKFKQNHDCYGKLMESGYAILIENSKTDSFWGCGKNGKGKNMLGKLLMQVRDELRKELID